MRILIFDDHEAIQYFVKQQIENIVPNVEKTVKLTPLRRLKVTPTRRCKLTP
jgi:hypothetical protein